jgi:3-oxoacyl-[acyl-carrier protein] reductase
VQADVGEPSQIQRMIEKVTSELGLVSMLVNNAGVVYRGTLENFDPAGVQRMWRTNVDGVTYMTRTVVPGMAERRYGRVVNLSSVAAHGTAMPDTTFYAASKAAVSVLTRRVALELGRGGITVNAVAPGFIPTEMSRQVAGEGEYQDVAKRVSELSMVGRVGEPGDIANAVLFLLTPDSGFITGQILTVDGGRTDFIGHP